MNLEKKEVKKKKLPVKKKSVKTTTAKKKKLIKSTKTTKKTPEQEYAEKVDEAYDEDWYEESNNIWESLTRRQKLFCEFYVTQEFFCNGTRSYQKVYQCGYETAKTLASNLLTNLNILNYIDKLLDDMWLNNQRVDKEMAKLILQDNELWIKLWAIKEYNSLKQRITKKLELSWWVVTEMSKEDKVMYNKILKHNLWNKGTKK